MKRIITERLPSYQHVPLKMQEAESLSSFLYIHPRLAASKQRRWVLLKFFDRPTDGDCLLSATNVRTKSSPLAPRPLSTIREKTPPPPSVLPTTIIIIIDRHISLNYWWHPGHSKMTSISLQSFSSLLVLVVYTTSNIQWCLY